MIDNITAITAVVAFAILVIFLAVPLWELGAVFAQLGHSIKELSDETVVTIKQGQDSFGQVNNRLEQVGSVTSAANRSIGGVSVLTTSVAATPGKPLIKVAAFSYVMHEAMGLNQEGQEET